MFFKEMRKGYPVHILDTVSIPVYKQGNIITVSEPRYQQPAQVPYGQVPPIQDRVLDITVEVEGKNLTYVVPENHNVAMASGITISCDIEPLMSQLAAMKKNSEDALGNTDKHKETIAACDNILESINPTFKQTKEQDRRIKKIEDTVQGLGASFDELKDLIIKKFKD